MSKMTAAVTYVWKGGKGQDESTAQVIGERLATIERKKGVLKAEFVVEDAQSNKSPLHKYFEWDDTAAAVKWRLEQAQSLIRHIHVKQIGNRDIGTPTRAFVNYRSEEDGEKRYENIVTVMTDSKKRELLLNKAKQELSDWRKRYDDLREMSELFPVIDRVLAA